MLPRWWSVPALAGLGPRRTDCKGLKVSLLERAEPSRHITGYTKRTKTPGNFRTAADTQQQMHDHRCEARNYILYEGQPWIFMGGRKGCPYQEEKPSPGFAVHVGGARYVGPAELSLERL